MDSDHVQELVVRLERLGAMPDDASLARRTDLIQKYQDVTSEIYDLTAETGTPKDPRLLWPLVASFGDGTAFGLYWTVLHTLERYPLDILRPTLHRALRVGTAGSRIWCAYMLGRQRNLEDVSPLTSLLGDEVPKVREAALKALAMIGDPAAEVSMTALLSDSDAGVRKWAADAIAALRDRRRVVG